MRTIERKTTRHFAGRWLFMAALLMLILLGGRFAGAAERNPIQSVWQRVVASGSYAFTAEITQTTTPLAAIENIGRTSSSERLYLEGSTALADETMRMTLWQNGGSVGHGSNESGIEIEVDGATARARMPGQAWESIDNVTGLFAPGGNFLAWLNAVDNVVDHGEQQTQTALGSVRYTRHTFDIDSRAYARFVREQLTASDPLPAGLTRQLPEVFANMSGSGELWVDANGLPLRPATQPATASERRRTGHDCRHC